MDITVKRTESPEGDLVFTITVKNPHKTPFGDIEMGFIDEIEKSIYSLNALDMNKSKIKIDAISYLHDLKEKSFVHVISDLKFAIRNSLETKWRPICQEIYNWIYDHQDGNVKKWLQEFDPQRTKYYFDNDTTIESDFSNDF